MKDLCHERIGNQERSTIHAESNEEEDVGTSTVTYEAKAGMGG
jgi:hypothetical protein